MAEHPFFTAPTSNPLPRVRSFQQLKVTIVTLRVLVGGWRTTLSALQPLIEADVSSQPLAVALGKVLKQPRREGRGDVDVEPSPGHGAYTKD